MKVIMFFFFSSRRRHTRYWRDWSSDVCSSDLYRKNGKIVLFNFLGLAPKEYDEVLSFSDIQESILFYLQEEKLFGTLTKLRNQLETQLLKRKRKDRKSTRLNSSHANISYAVFC